MGILLLTSLSLVSQAQVGSLDAFRSNFAAIKAEIIFEFHYGYADLKTIDRLRLWNTKGINIKENLDHYVGRWRCDGSAVHLTFMPVDRDLKDLTADEIREILDKKAHKDIKKSSTENQSQNINRSGFEELSNDELDAQLKFDDPTFIDVNLLLESGLIQNRRDPFSWWGSYRFPYNLIQDLSHEKSSTQSTMIHDFPLEVLSFQKKMDSGEWYRYDFFHDPSAAYLPRYVRMIGASDNGSVCKEMFLIETRRCAAGGFVPLEYYETEFVCVSPRYSENPKLDMSYSPRPRGGDFPFVLGHFLVKDFKDFKGKAALEPLKVTHSITARGGRSPLTSNTPLTIERMKLILGKKIYEHGPVRPTIDVEEINELTPRPRKGWSWGWIVAGISLVCITLASRRYWKSSFSKLSILIPISIVILGIEGCSRIENPQAQRIRSPHTPLLNRIDLSPIHLTKLTE
jgi:hypothetical protein